MSNKKYNDIFDYFKKNDKEIIDFQGILGEGAFGKVRLCFYGKKICAAKLVEREKSGKIDPEKLRGKNIIEIIKISQRKIEDKYYDLIIMEMALLRDIKTFIKNLFNFKLLKTINWPFDEIVGNNILRFFTKQIVNGMETLERNELAHFDIKPENILITSELTIKLSDFSFLKDLNQEKNSVIIPGGTKGYVPPEYYYKYIVDSNLAKKHDYFALGATLYYLKFNRPLLKYNDASSKEFTNIHVINLLQKNISLLKSNLLLDKNFISFLCSLVDYLPQERPNFEQIYRNKWLNENSEEIREITNSYYQSDERKLIMELIKSDFLIEKKKKNKNIKKSRFHFVK